MTLIVGEARALGVEDIEIEITVQMRIKDWKALRATLGNRPEAWPAVQFSRLIDNLIDQFVARFENKQKDTE